MRPKVYTVIRTRVRIGPDYPSVHRSYRLGTKKKRVQNIILYHYIEFIVDIWMIFY